MSLDVAVSGWRKCNLRGCQIDDNDAVANDEVAA
jgi:hypothetical protein